MNQTAIRTDDPARLMHSIIQRIATGPQLSKDIARQEAYLGMKAILEGQIDSVQTGIFFIALRMKRETDEENQGVLDAILEATHRVTAAADEVVDIADPYDGYTRSLPASPFLPPLLAELGLPAVNHGVDRVGPKYGVTARHVLLAAGVDVDLSPQAAAARLSNSALGWTYIDQARFCPKLHDLVPLRGRIVKRQAVTTVEVAARPIVGRQRTHFVTGYVHKPYPPVYAMLARHAGFDSGLIIRGTEGGVIPNLRQSSPYYRFQDRGAEVEARIDPRALGVAQELRAVPLPEGLPRHQAEDQVAGATERAAMARAAAEAGLAALSGQRSPTYDALLIGAALILHHVGRARTLGEAADRVRAVLDSGRALTRVK